MKVKTFFKCMMLIGIIPFSSIMMANNNTPEEEKVIVLIEQNNNGTDDKNHQIPVPVTATVNNQVLNVQFTGTVPHATVRVNNALTGTTVSQQSVSAIAGTVSTVPVAGLSWGTYTVSVTNNVNGQSVSGDFNVK